MKHLPIFMSTIILAIAVFRLVAAEDENSTADSATVPADAVREVRSTVGKAPFVSNRFQIAGAYCGSGNDSHWVDPYLTLKPGYRELLLGYEFNPARRVPLFQLVHQDSVYCTRRWNQDPSRDATLWDCHDLARPARS